MKGVWTRIGNTLVPASAEATESLRAVKDGRHCVADVRASRNPKQLRLFWALVGVLVENTDRFGSKQEAKQRLCEVLGYVEPYWDMYGRFFLIAKSIAVESMEQAVFNQFFQRAVDKVCQWLDAAPEEVREEVHNMIDPMRGYDESQYPRAVQTWRKGNDESPRGYQGLN